MVTPTCERADCLEPATDLVRWTGFALSVWHCHAHALDSKRKPRR